MEPDEYNYDRNNEAAKPLPDTFSVISHTPRLSRMCDASKRQCHNAMVKYAEAKSQEVATEFLDWVMTEVSNSGIDEEGGWHIMPDDNGVHLTTKELFLKYKQSRP